MTPRLPPRVSISKLTLGRSRQAEPETRAGEGGSHARAGLGHGATRKSHAPTEPPVVRARPPETPPAPPPNTDGQQTDAQRRHRRRSPSSLHLSQCLTSPLPRNCLGLATHGDFYGTQTCPRRDLSAPPPTPDPHPKPWSSPQLHTQFLQLLHFPWLCRSSIPTDPQNQNRPLIPQLLRSRAQRSRVAPLAWLPYPLCPSPPGPRGSPRPTWPPPPKGGGISGVARDVATCAAEAACVRVRGGGPSGGRKEEGGRRRAEPARR